MCFRYLSITHLNYTEKVNSRVLEDSGGGVWPSFCLWNMNSNLYLCRVARVWLSSLQVFSGSCSSRHFVGGWWGRMGWVIFCTTKATALYSQNKVELNSCAGWTQSRLTFVSDPFLKFMNRTLMRNLGKDGQIWKHLGIVHFLWWRCSVGIFRPWHAAYTEGGSLWPKEDPDTSSWN